MLIRWQSICALATTTLALLVSLGCGTSVELSSGKQSDPADEPLSQEEIVSNWQVTRHPSEVEPPSNWQLHSEPEFGLSWHTPEEPKVTRRPGQPPAAIFDARVGSTVISLTCINTPTFIDGSPREFLDALDEGMIAGMERNGIEADLLELDRVELQGRIGRISRIDAPGARRGMKCDLTSPDRCYSVSVVGNDDGDVARLLERFVGSMRFSD